MEVISRAAQTSHQTSHQKIHQKATYHYEGLLTAAQKRTLKKHDHAMRVDTFSKTILLGTV